MGCDAISSSRAARMLVICLWLQYISVSLSVPRAFTNSVAHSESGRLAKQRIRREDHNRAKRRYDDYSDEVVSYSR